MRKIILINVFSIVASFIFFLAVGETTINLKDYYEQNRNYYGDVSLDYVAKDVYNRSNIKQPYDHWLIETGIKSQIEEDNYQRAVVKSQEQIKKVESVGFIFLITWPIGLLLPLIVRYAIIGRAIANLPTIGICILFCVINFVLFTVIINQSMLQGDLTLISFVSCWILLPDGLRYGYSIALTLITLMSYWILRRGTATEVINVSAQTPGPSASFLANSTDFPNPANADQHIGKVTSASTPDRSANKELFADRLEVSVDEDRIYAEIATELETGAMDKGLWTRLFAECSGDEQQMRVLYIKLRAERLISAERIAAKTEVEGK